MRILLDECIDEGLRHSFFGHECQTARYAGLKGLSNGKLLAAAEQAGFAVLVTLDKNMQYQQRLENRTISLAVLDSRTTRLDDLLHLVPDLLLRFRALNRDRFSGSASPAADPRRSLLLRRE